MFFLPLFSRRFDKLTACLQPYFMDVCAPSELESFLKANIYRIGIQYIGDINWESSENHLAYFLPDECDGTEISD